METEDIIERLERAERTLHILCEAPSCVLLDDAIEEIKRLRKIEVAATDLSLSLLGGFVVCECCGQQETTTDLDYAVELRRALGIEPDLARVDETPF